MVVFFSATVLLASLYLNLIGQFVAFDSISVNLHAKFSEDGGPDKHGKVLKLLFNLIASITVGCCQIGLDQFSYIS